MNCSGYGTSLIQLLYVVIYLKMFDTSGAILWQAVGPNLGSYTSTNAKGQ